MRHILTMGWLLCVCLLVGCASSVDRAALQSRLNTLVSFCESLDRAGSFDTMEARIACWRQSVRTVLVDGQFQHMDALNAYDAEVHRLATLYERGHLDEMTFQLQFIDATQRFS